MYRMVNCRLWDCLPTGVPGKVPFASTPGGAPLQLGSATGAPSGNPLKNIANYKSAGWKKDPGHILSPSTATTTPPIWRWSGRS